MKPLPPPVDEPELIPKKQPPAVAMPEVQPTAGFGPQVPDTTKQVPAVESPGALFTADSASNLTDTLQQFADKAPAVTPEQTMQGQLETFLDKNNPLFDKARGDAMAYANSRGLVNSSIAAGAGEEAVLGVAMPVAQHDAGVYAQRAAQEAQFWQAGGLQATEGMIQSTMMAQDHLQQLVAMSTQGDINSRLQLEQFGYNWQLSEQENLQQMQQLALQGDINSRLALQKFGFDTRLMEQDFGYRIALSQKELQNALALSGQDHSQWMERIAAGHSNTLSEIEAQGEQNRLTQESGLQDQEALNIATFTRNLQASYLQAAERRTGQFSAEVTSIYQQEGLTAAQQANAVAVARSNYNNDLNMLADYYRQSPYWDPNWGTSTTAPTTPGPPPRPNIASALDNVTSTFGNLPTVQELFGDRR